MVNKTKKELCNENQKLQAIIKSYEDFYGIEEIVTESEKQLRFTRRALWITSAILLILSAFLIGLMWRV